MLITADRVGDVDVVTLTMPSLDAASAAAFKRDMEEAIPPGAEVVIDLGAVGFIDSAGLGALLSCLRRLTAADGDLKLCGMSGPVRSVFELVRLHRVMDIFETRDEAIRAFANHERAR